MNDKDLQGTSVRCACHGLAKMCEVGGTAIEIIRNGHVVVIEAREVLAMMAGTVGRDAILRFVGSAI